MVLIHYPSTAYELFFVHQEAIITTVIDPFAVYSPPVSVDSPLDALSQGHEARQKMTQGRERLGGENSVDHQKIEADITVSLLRFEAASGLPGNPHAVTYKYQSKTMVANHGYFDDGTSRITGEGTTNPVLWGFRLLTGVYHQYQLVYDAPRKRLTWWDFWTKYEPVSLGRATFTSGATSSSIPGTAADIQLMSVDVLASMPAAKGTTLYHHNYGSRVSLYSVYFRTSTNTLPTVNKVIKDVARAAFGMSLTKCPIQDYDYGDLALEAANNSRLNEVNMLAFIADIRNPKSMVPKLKNLKNLPKDPELLRGLRNASEDYLSYHYGVLPTVDDINSVLEAARRCSQYYDRNGFAVYTAGRETSHVKDNTTWYVNQRIKIATAADELVFSSILRGFDNVGLFPSYENVWDLIPFSFVVDWFVDVGNFLEDYDNLLRLDRLNVKYVTMSKKTTSTQTISSPETGANGTMSLVQYHRWVTRQCPVPKLALSRTSQTQTHWVESGALILSRTHK